VGGFGSGRKWGKDCTDDMRQIDVRRLVRDGYLKAGMAYGWQWTRRSEVVASINVAVEANQVWFTYRQRELGGEWQDVRYPVRLDRTACHLGGERVWWRCPAAGCGRRVAILFGGSIFACRNCHKLAYRCQREADDDRAARRADKLRDSLGWEPGILNGEGWKPKGMHWRTYERLRAEHDARVNASLMGMARRFKLNIPRLE
jgi:hypothetical protein